MDAGFTREITIFLDILGRHRPQPAGSYLVVGCGDGLEALTLHQLTAGEVAGIDARDDFRDEARRQLRLHSGDARALPFPDASFDVVYSYHALEHIPQPAQAVAEMRRVLRPGGAAYVGTPNKARLLGYIGSARATRAQKVLWNLKDWSQRLAGRFSNEQGAHAGFYQRELAALLASHFTRVTPVRDDYFRLKYAAHRRAIEFLIRSGLGEFLFPSVYFLCLGEPG